MNENFDRDPFADDAKRRQFRLRRLALRDVRRAQRAACGAAAAAGTGRSLTSIRHARPCPDAARGPLRRPGA